MTFLPQASNLCQDTSQCYHPVMLISYIGLVCDVITAIGLKKHMYYDTNVVPLGYVLNLTENKAYHQIAKMLPFQMVYNLFLCSQGWLNNKNSRTSVICIALAHIATLMSHNNTQGATY